jgi:hypothetical protein
MPGAECLDDVIGEPLQRDAEPAGDRSGEPAPVALMGLEALRRTCSQQPASVIRSPANSSLNPEEPSAWMRPVNPLRGSRMLTVAASRLAKRCCGRPTTSEGSLVADINP